MKKSFNALENTLKLSTKRYNSHSIEDFLENWCYNDIYDLYLIPLIGNMDFQYFQNFVENNLGKWWHVENDIYLSFTKEQMKFIMYELTF